MFIVFGWAISSAVAQPIYSRVKIAAGFTDIVSLALADIDLEGADFQSDSISVILPQSDLQILDMLGYTYRIVVKDMTEYYVTRARQEATRLDLKTSIKLNTAYPIPAGFDFGSMGGFCTYDEFLEHLDRLRAKYPSLITARYPVSSTIVTHEGRPVYMVRISSDPSKYQEQKPKVLYTGLTHAREPITMQHLLYFMYFLLENYPKKPEIKYLIDNAELYFVPVVNPDGYIYNQQISPKGGGMWRKNRRAISETVFGVDLNRNFGFQWGYNNIGSSAQATSESYRGPGPFSEPETQMIKQLCESIPFTIVLNYHSYSNLLLYPWGYQFAGTPDDLIFSTHASLMTTENYYRFGPSSTTIYQTNGSSDDWMYGEQTSKQKMYAYTPEIGTNNDGFWPLQSRIIPLCQENMLQSLMAGFFSLRHSRLTPAANPNLTGNQGYVAYDLQRLGFQEGGNFTVSLQALGMSAGSTGVPRNYSNLRLLQSVRDSIAFTLTPGTPVGTAVKFVLQLSNGFYTKSDTVVVQKSMLTATRTPDRTELDVFPNPFDGELNITLAEPADVKTVEIFNSNGSMVYSQNQPIRCQTLQLNTEALLPGFYILRINTQTGTRVQKILKR